MPSFSFTIATQSAPPGDTSLIDQTVDAIGPLLAEYGLQVLGALVFLVVALFLSGWAARASRRALERARIEQTLARFVGKAVRIAILVLAIITCLHIFGVPMTSVAAVVGASGIAVGLALQGSLSNIAAGAMLAIFRPFRVSDMVVLAGHTGRVVDIDLFTTHLDTPDNRRIILPNNQIVGNVIENITRNPIRRVEVNVGVEYSADLDRTRDVLTRAAAAVPGCASDPPPIVRLDSLGDSAVLWKVFVWAPRDQFHEVRDAATRRVKKDLDEAGIGIPFPQRVVHMRGPITTE